MLFRSEAREASEGRNKAKKDNENTAFTMTANLKSNSFSADLHNFSSWRSFKAFLGRNTLESLQRRTPLSNKSSLGVSNVIGTAVELQWWRTAESTDRIELDFMPFPASHETYNSIELAENLSFILC